MKVYIAQMEVIPGKPEENFKTMKAIVARAKKAGADMVAFPDCAVSGNYCGLGVRNTEWSFQKECRDAEKALAKLSKGIEILMGCSEAFDICMYDYYVNGEMEGWEHDFEVYSGLQQFTLDKDNEVKAVCGLFAKDNKKVTLYVNAVGTENSGKNIYALDGTSRVYDASGKEVFRMEQFNAGEALVEIKNGKVKVLPLDGKPAPKSAKVSEPIVQIHDALVYMIRENLARFHIGRMVIGASGGIDSAVSAVLYAEAMLIKDGRTNCFYDVTVTDELGRMIAVVDFTGAHIKKNA